MIGITKSEKEREREPRRNENNFNAFIFSSSPYSLHIHFVFHHLCNCRLTKSKLHWTLRYHGQRSADFAL